MNKNAILRLEDGSTFPGKAFGARVPASGEVVFNAGMVGYPETLNDPSYHGQILAFTYPLIGNYGVSGKRRDRYNLLEHFESERVQVAGVVVQEYSVTLCVGNMNAF